jgi:hypothetical protein
MDAINRIGELPAPVLDNAEARLSKSSHPVTLKIIAEHIQG